MKNREFLVPVTAAAAALLGNQPADAAIHTAADGAIQAGIESTRSLDAATAIIKTAPERFETFVLTRGEQGTLMAQHASHASHESHSSHSSHSSHYSGAGGG